MADIARAKDTVGLGAPDASWPLPIHSVMVGPSAQKTLNVESTMMLLRQNGYDGVDVRASQTPYRG